MTAAASGFLDRRRGPRIVWALGALALLGAAVVASVGLGARSVGWGDVASALLGIDGGTDSIDAAAASQRVPRTVLALAVGASLAVGGTVLQGVTRNPLADPGLLGISSGASLAVVAGITFAGLSSPASYLWLAVAGAGGAALFVWGVASLGRGGPTTLRLALAGAATWASLSSITSALLLPRVDVMDEFRFWQVGGVGGAQWTRIGQVAPFLVVGAVVCLGSARGLNALALGDDVAAGLGARVGRTRLVAAGGAVLLCGGATAVAGPIGFVGLVAAHLTRLAVGPDHRWLLPLSGVAGAVLLTTADVVGRLVARPDEVDVGIVSAFIGAPVFVWAVRRQTLRAL